MFLKPVSAVARQEGGWLAVGTQLRPRILARAHTHTHRVGSNGHSVLSSADTP